MTVGDHAEPPGTSGAAEARAGRRRSRSSRRVSALGFMGRATVIAGTDLAAVWPAAGVRVVWLLVRQAGPLSLDTALLFGAMLASALLSGYPAVAGALARLPPTRCRRSSSSELMRRALPELWGVAGPRPSTRRGRWPATSPASGTGVLVSTVVGVCRVAAGRPGRRHRRSPAALVRAQRLRRPRRGDGRAAALAVPRPAPAPAPALGGQQAGVRRRLHHERAAVRARVPRRRALAALPGPRRA